MADNPILDFNNFGDKLYKMFPESYRNDDSKQEYALKRFLQGVSEGYAVVIKDINDNMDLIDPLKTPKENLFKLYKQYGIEMNNGISETYLRSFLNDIGYIWQEKGSLGVISYVATSITGGGVFIFPERTETGVTLYLTVFLENARDMEVFPTIEQFTRIVENFTPFYCDVVAELIKDFVEKVRVTFSEENTNSATENVREENSQLGFTYPVMGMFTNNSFCVLNREVLNIPQLYDNIYSGSTLTRTIFHTPEGSIG